MEDSIDKKYYKIKEVSILLDLPQPTLRFWESQFSILRPFRDPKGNRYYTPRDLETLKMIKYLVKVRGLKIEAAKAEIKNNRQGVEKRYETIERLKNVRDQLTQMLNALNAIKR